VALVVAQVTLGAFIIWSQKDVAINTAHVITGALTLATSLVLTLRSHRVRFADSPAVSSAVAPAFSPDLNSSGARA
jgi:hypothetical protein